MKILHIVAAKVWGGGESAALSMCKTLKTHGHEVDIVVSGNVDLLKHKFSQAGKVTAIKFSWSSVFSCVSSLRRLLKDNQIEVIHTHTGKVIPFALLAAQGLAAKVIAYRHNAIKNKNDLIHQLIYKRLAAMVCVSEFVKRCQAIDMPQWVKDKLYVVHNGIESAGPRVAKQIESGRLVLGYAGRIEENKGLLYLVKALEQINSEGIVLKIAGDDNTKYAQQVKQYLQQGCLGGKVIWLGYVADIASFYEQIDVLVCPSIVPEAFGLSICEAMYYGKTVITSNNGAQPEIINDTIDGFLTNSGDEQAIATIIKKLMIEPERCITIGKKAKEKIEEKYTMDNWLRKMMAVYKLVLTKNSM